MARDTTAVYINVAPEFGGGRLGPFSQMEIRFGCDNSRCHVFIPEQLGVSREHARLLRQDDDSLIVTPAERTAAVYVWKGDARRPTQVLTPTAMRSGDAISLVSPDGPKFIVEMGKLPVEAKAAGGMAGRKRFTVGGFVREVQRVAWATLYTFSPVAILARVKLAWESGLIFTPRFIVSAMLLMSGWLMAGPTGCVALKKTFEASNEKEKAADLQSQLDVCTGHKGDDPMSMTVGQLIALRLNGHLATTLEKDKELGDAVKSKATSIVANPQSYNWIFEAGTPQSDFVSWRKQVEAQKGKLDDDTILLLPYLAATTDRKNVDFKRVLDSQDQRVCGRGPLRMTWRQAHALGMSALMLDAYTPGDTTDTGIRSNLLKKTMASALDPNLDPLIQDTTELESETVNLLQGSDYCVTQVGTDDRDNVAKLAKLMVANIGMNAANLPNGQNSNAGPPRIARYFAADVPQIHFGGGTGTEINLNMQILSNAIKAMPKAAWVMDQTAEVIARSIMLPCMAALQGREKAPALSLVFGDAMKDPVSCLVLNYRLANQ